MLRERGLSPIPVTACARDRTYHDVVRGLAACGLCGVCLGLSLSDLVRDGTASATAPLEYLRVRPEAADLVVDLGYLSGPVANVSSALMRLPELERWRTLVLVSGAFPQDLSNFKPGIHRLTREDWRTWCGLAQTPLQKYRLPRSLSGKAHRGHEVYFISYQSATDTTICRRSWHQHCLSPTGS
jgi:hypothetical protein